jgi:hypothetical protein
MPVQPVLDFSGTAQPLMPADLDAALRTLELDGIANLPLLWAVLTVESRGFGFLADRRPKVLFERHIFFRETGGRFAATAPDLCAKTGGGYAGGAAEYNRIGRALALCRRSGLGDELALNSASWGLGQIMGFNARSAGFSDASAMVTAMSASEGAQLTAMAGFMKSEGLDGRLKTRDWTGFARRYNGPAYWKNAYDVKLKAAFDKFSSGVSRDLRARAAQGALLFLGYQPGDPDGIVGQNTHRAIQAFRADAGLGASTALDEGVFRAIMSKAGLAWSANALPG